MPAGVSHRQERALANGKREYGKLAAAVFLGLCLTIPYIRRPDGNNMDYVEWGVVGYVCLTFLQSLVGLLICFFSAKWLLYLMTAMSAVQVLASFALGNLAAPPAFRAWGCCNVDLSSLDVFLEHLDTTCGSTDCALHVVEYYGLVLSAWIVFFCSVHTLLWHKEMRILLSGSSTYEQYSPSAPLTDAGRNFEQL